MKILALNPGQARSLIEYVREAVLAWERPTCRLATLSCGMRVGRGELNSVVKAVVRSLMEKRLRVNGCVS